MGCPTRVHAGIAYGRMRVSNTGACDYRIRPYATIEYGRMRD